jgi:PIN domain nuclease of toxin-antitoxin system
VSPSAYLLDTPVLLWSLTDPKSLTANARAVIENRQSTLYVSAASAWELATKHRLGKLPQAEVLLSGFGRLVKRMVADQIDITAAHALLAGALEWDHRDPFDRMLAAQCMTESLTLITANPVFSDRKGLAVLW